jgi:hypothetical protein
MVDSTPTPWDKCLRGWLFIELQPFSLVRDAHFGGDEHFALFQTHLAALPDVGDVMPGCNGLRKVRWNDPRRGKGKRGGLRVVYLTLPEIRVILLVDVYDKGEAEDLSPREKQIISRHVGEVKRALLTRYAERKEN